MTRREGADTEGRAVTAPGQVERDRVLDAVKTFALLVVVVAHSIAWDVSSGDPASVLDLRPGLTWLTWTLQILPLFFAAGAVANLGSWLRRPDPAAFLRRRLVRLATPALVYAACWTIVFLPVSAFLPEGEIAGRFLSQLLWFLGVYAAAVAAVPWTSRWVTHPVLTLTTWLGLIVAVDALRLTVAPTAGWLNLLLVWAWLHQLGYHLPALRRWSRARLLTVAATSFGVALALALLGPYSSSLVTRAGDPEPSNLSPPTVVVALYGLAQVLVLASLWPWITRLLSNERAWRAIGFVALRAIGIYLWHIPWVAAVAATAWLAGFPAEPLSPFWWLAHLGGLAAILTMAWFTAGLASRGDRRLTQWATGQTSRVLPAIPFAIPIPAALLAITISGFGTWRPEAFLGIPAPSAVNLGLLAAAWWALSVGRSEPSRHP